MIDMVRAKDILLDIPYISNTIIQENSPYINKGFSQGLQCNLLLKISLLSFLSEFPEHGTVSL